MPEHASPPSIPPTAVLPSLLDALRGLILAHRPAFGQEHTFLRVPALLFGHLFAFARRILTLVLVAFGLTEYDWSAFYKLFGTPRIDYEELTRCFFRQTLGHARPAEPYYEAFVDGCS